MNLMKSSALLGMLAVGLVTSACGGASSSGNGNESVSATAQAISVATATAGTPRSLLTMDGTYGAGCKNRSGNWSLPLNGYMGGLANPLLTVVTNNTNCVLSITDVGDASVYYTAAPAVVLGATQSAASAFASPIAFYGSAIQSDVTYASDFTITFTYSDVPGVGSDTNTTNTVIAAASASANDVPSPDYTLTDSIVITIDANQPGSVVQSVSGELTLNYVSHIGEAYVVVLPDTSHGSVGSFTEDDFMFNSAGGGVTIPDGSLHVSIFSQLGLGAGAVLPYSVVIVVRNLVIGVPSYESFQVTFNSN